MPSGSWQGKAVGLMHYKTLDPCAAAWITEPYMAVVGQDLLHGTFPAWNPYQAFGTPLAADMLSQPFYPLTALFSLHASPTAYNYFILARLFIAGICAFLYLRLFISFTPAISGAISSMLAGYYLLYVTIAHMSVEVLLPGSLLAAEYLLRRRTFGTVVGFAVVLALTIIGGMPESTLLLLLFVYSYLVFRLITDRQLRAEWLRTSCHLLAATLAGFCLSAFLLLPFVELLRHSFNIHDSDTIKGLQAFLGVRIPGVLHDPLDLSLFTYIFPLLYGPPLTQTLSANWTGVRNYVGIIAFFLALVAIVQAFRGSKARQDRTLRQITIFFSACVLLVLLKRYGIEPINYLGRLPMLRFEFFFKYDEPILSVSVAVLSALGLDALIKRQVSTVVQICALLFAFSVAPVALFLSRAVLSKELLTEHILPAFPTIAVGLPVFLLFIVAVCLLASNGRPQEHQLSRPAFARYLGVGIVALLTLELSGNYIPELYYALNVLPDKTENPYVGAPYITWLRDHNPNSYRVFGREGALYPNWASVFHLFDIRNLDALYYKKYLPFVRAFLISPGQLVRDDLQDRFTGFSNYEYSFSTPLQKRLLQLSSAKYLITVNPYSSPFNLEYNKELKIYGYDKVLPRAAVYYNVRILPDEAEVLKTLTDPNLNIFRTVLLDKTKLKPQELEAVMHVNSGQSEPVQAATITSIEPNKVEISASLDRSGILVLNDSDYPGWKVTVDGKPGEWTSANYIFRAVVLPPGAHKVNFIYHPKTYFVGGGISIFTALILCFFPVARKRFRIWVAREPAPV